MKFYAYERERATPAVCKASAPHKLTIASKVYQIGLFSFACFHGLRRVSRSACAPTATPSARKCATHRLVSAFTCVAMAFVIPVAALPFAPHAPFGSHTTRRASFVVPRRTISPCANRRSTQVARTMTPMLSVSVASSDLSCTEQAVHAALDTALSTTPSPTIAIVTHTVDRSASEVHALIRSRLPHVHIHGATTCAALLSNAGAVPNGVGIMLHDSDGMSSAACSLDNCDVTEAANRVASQLKGELGDVASVLLCASPGIEEQVLHTFSTLLPGVKVFGGSAADNTVSGQWSLLCDAGVFSQGLTAVGIKPDVPFGSCLLPPYEKGDKFATVTKCDGRVIHELDGKAAAEVLRDWVGASVDAQSKDGGPVIVECAAFPLGIERVSGGWIAIHAAEITREGSVGLFAEAKEGDKLTVMRKMGGSDSATAASIALEQAYKQAMNQGRLTDPKAGVLIYCGGLSIAVGDELNRSLEPMKGKAAMLGMTAFGEQGHVAGSNLHSNLAVGVALFG